MSKKEEEPIEEVADTKESAKKIRDAFADLEVKLEETENKYKRAIADYQNLQKRSLEDRSEWIKSANKELLLRILTVLDTLILAFQHLEDKNIQVSINHFMDVLRDEGVTRIETVGKKFDPAVMEAITTVEGEEGIVVNEIRAGFLLHERLLRPAQVTVGEAKQKTKEKKIWEK